MFRDSAHPDKSQMTSASEAISHCLKMVMALSISDLSESSSLSALRALRDTIDSLLQRHATASTQDHSTVTENHPKAGRFGASEVSGRNSDEEDGASDSGASEPGARFWRTKRRSQSEKDEKRARLEKREEILRNLRNRVAEFKSEKIEDKEPGREADAQSAGKRLEKFQMRRQRASFWPQGSVEWARQLLGIELGMDLAEKRQCYLEMVKACHPDQNQAVPPDAIQLVTAAWEIVR